MNKSTFKIFREQELIDLLKDKDELSFKFLYHNYSGALYTFVLQIIPDKQIASDIIHDAFVNIWFKIDSYDSSKGRLFTWMLNIARNLSIDMLRSKTYQNRKRNLYMEDFAYTTRSVKVAELNIESIGLKKAVSKLKPEHQKMIDLVYFKGYTCRQISSINKAPLGTIKTRLRSALTQLRHSFL